MVSNVYIPKVETEGFVNYFPKANSVAGHVYLINGVPWLVRGLHQIVTGGDDEELEIWGWDANDLSQNCKYRFLTQGILKNADIREVEV